MGNVDNLLNKISKCQRELKVLQDNCAHVEKDIRFVDYEKGVRFVCRDCKSVLGWPSNKEVDKWVSK